MATPQETGIPNVVTIIGLKATAIDAAILDIPVKKARVRPKKVKPTAVKPHPRALVNSATHGSGRLKAVASSSIPVKSGDVEIRSES
jgi:hypothetical protein